MCFPSNFVYVELSRSSILSKFELSTCTRNNQILYDLIQSLCDFWFAYNPRQGSFCIYQNSCSGSLSTIYKELVGPSEVVELQPLIQKIELSGGLVRMHLNAFFLSYLVNYSQAHFEVPSLQKISDIKIQDFGFLLWCLVTDVTPWDLSRAARLFCLRKLPQCVEYPETGELELCYRSSDLTFYQR